jgi:hypothetical protein
VAVLLGRNVLPNRDSFFSFFITLSWVVAALCLVLLVPCWRYFAAHPATRRKPELGSLSESQSAA